MRRLTWAICIAIIVSNGYVDARTVRDLAGRTVEIPDRIDRVACLEVLCYPHMFMLGASDRIAAMVETAAPWMRVTNPKVDSIPKLGVDADIEEVAAANVTIAVFLYNFRRMLPKLNTIGVPALVGQPLRQPADVAAFAADIKAMVRLYGRILGGEAEARSEEWCAYFDSRTAAVAERLADISRESRIRLYYVRGPQALNTQGRGSYTFWLGEMAGARMVIGAAPLAGRATASMEDIVRWDPEVILVGRQYSPDLVLQDPRWRMVSAVRNGRIVPMPAGVFYWDGGPESMLLIPFLAKTLYPERFPDLDLITELKTYYAKFYRYNLTDDEAGKILRGEWPDGRRFNPLNN